MPKPARNADGTARRPCVKTDGTPSRKKDGTRCENNAMRGTNVCRTHGGKAPQVKRKAEQKIALADATKMARSILGAAGQTLEPVDALTAAQQHCEAMILTYQIAMDALVAIHGQPAMEPKDDKGMKIAHPFMVELRHWTDLYQRIATGTLKAGVDERRVRVNELQLAEMRRRIEGYAHAKGIDLTNIGEVQLIQEWFGPDPPSTKGAIARAV